MAAGRRTRSLPASYKGRRGRQRKGGKGNDANVLFVSWYEATSGLNNREEQCVYEAKRLLVYILAGCKSSFSTRGNAYARVIGQ